MARLEQLDWVVIGLYFLALVGIVWWSARRQRSSEDYFLAGRNVGWLVIGASLFASNIGSEHLVGLAGTGFTDGMAMAHYELHAWCLLVLGWVFVPFYSRSGIFTMPEFLERRYNPTARWILSVISLVAYVFTKVSVTLYAGGVVFSVLLPGTILGMDSFWVGAVTVMVLTGIYTVLGGLRAVVYTDTLQTLVLIVGSVFVTIYGLRELGGWGGFREACETAKGGANHFNMWRPADDATFPWAGILFGAPIVGLWYWCTDQYIVQRTLAARNMKIARRGTIWGAYLKLSPVFLFIIPGMIAFALFAQGKLPGLEKKEPTTAAAGPARTRAAPDPGSKDAAATTGPTGATEPAGKAQTKRQAVPDRAFPVLVKDLLPLGLRGLVVAGLLSALMSSLSSLYNSCSTLFTVDIYKKLHPGVSEATLVRVGRIATAVVVLLGMLWIPLMKYVSRGLYLYLQSVQAYLAPPITAAFFLGVFWRRINGVGAVTGLIVGFVLGMVKLAAQVLVGIKSVKVHLPGFVVALGQFNFLYFCLVLFAVSVAVIVVVSLLSRRPAAEKLNGLTYATTAAQAKQEVRASWTKWDVINTLIILSVIAAVYIYFTG